MGDGQYGTRRQACEKGASQLGVRALRDVTGDPDAAQLADPFLRRICGHVIAENRRVLCAGARMTGGGFGGSVVALIPAGRVGHVREAVTGRFARHGWPAPRYLDAVPSAAARRIWPDRAHPS